MNMLIIINLYIIFIVELVAIVKKNSIEYIDIDSSLVTGLEI